MLAFVAGALLASGIVYVAVRPESPKTLVAATVAPEKAVDPPAAEPRATDAPSLPPEEPKAVRRADAPVRSAKPAPAKVHREVAQAVVPPIVDAPVPQPAPAPVVEQAPPASVQPAPDPAPVPAPAEPTMAPPAAVPPPPPPTVTLQPGTVIAVRVGETISTQKNQPGDTFLATLSQPLVVDGFVIAERGARAEGKIVELERAGRVKGVAHMSVQLTKITTSDGQHVKVNTASFIKEGPTSTGTDAAKVGGGAALGAIIGAIAGGGKGAGIGAGAGGAAGAGDVLLTRGKDAVIPVETKITFRMQEAVSLTEQTR